ALPLLPNRAMRLPLLSDDEQVDALGAPAQCRDARGGRSLQLADGRPLRPVLALLAECGVHLAGFSNGEQVGAAVTGRHRGDARNRLERLLADEDPFLPRRDLL